jgi:hypothetical protein
MNNKRKTQIASQESIFASLKIENTSQQSLFIEWGELSDIFSVLLSGLLNRKIETRAEREEYYWLIDLYDTPLTWEELGILFTAANADEWDRDQNDFGDYPITELCQGLCNKLMKKLLPYGIDATTADDGGVRFIGSAETSIVKTLPDGTELIAEIWGEPEYPGIRISLRARGHDSELLCFAEHNSVKPAGKELCIAAYSSNQDEPAYYESYNDLGSPSPNV